MREDLKKVIEKHSHIVDKDKGTIIHLDFVADRSLLFVLDSTGKLSCYNCKENLNKTDIKNIAKIELGIRMKWQRRDLRNILVPVISSQNSFHLVTGGHIDNSIRIFDLSVKKKKTFPVIEVHHKNIVTSLKFSKSMKHFISCDADGIINHFVRKPGK